MKIAIIGVGAMGSVYAALLAEAGHEVWAVDPWQEHVEAIVTKGLRVEGASGDRIINGINATVNALVLTIQNGLGAGDRIAEHMATENVLLGVADGFGASMKAPGHAHHNAMKLIRIGELGGGMTDRLQTLEQQLLTAGFQAKAFADITQLIWEKFLCNVTFSAPCTVFDKTIGQLMADADHWRIALGAMHEAYRIARHRDIPLSFDNPESYVTSFGANMPNARPSMLLDHMAKRPSELDAINGMVPVMGRQDGFDTPYNDTLVAVLNAREVTFSGDPS